MVQILLPAIVSQLAIDSQIEFVLELTGILFLQNIMVSIIILSDFNICVYFIDIQ